MLPGKLIVTGMLIMTVAAGCTKKKSDKDNEFASSAKPATTQAATQDIFDEFYKEDSASAKTEKPVQTQPVVRSHDTPSFSENGRYCVQVSTLPSRSLADAVAAKLSAKGYPSYVAEVQNPTPALPGTFYRVRIGGFDGVGAARSFGDGTLATDGYEYWVDKRSNDNVGLDGYGMGGSGDTYYSTPAEASGAYSTYPSEPPPAPATTYTPEPAAEPEPPPPQPEAAPQTTTPATTNEWGGSDDW